MAKEQDEKNPLAPGGGGPRSAIHDEGIGGEGSGLVSQDNNQLMEATQTIYHLDKEEEEKGKG